MHQLDENNIKTPKVKSYYIFIQIFLNQIQVYVFLGWKYDGRGRWTYFRPTKSGRKFSQIFFFVVSSQATV